jgi:deoxycytidylate deaminase
MLTKRRQDKTKSKNEKFMDDKDIFYSSLKDITRKHEYFMEKAAEIAQKSSMQQKHGAIITYKNNIIASGFNYSCSYMCDNYSIHAEVAAISQVFYDKNLLKFCDIYVVRIAPAFNNCLKNSKPCKNCTNFIKKYSLRNTYYSTNDTYDKLYLSC